MRAYSNKTKIVLKRANRKDKLIGWVARKDIFKVYRNIITGVFRTQSYIVNGEYNLRK